MEPLGLNEQGGVNGHERRARPAAEAGPSSRGLLQKCAVSAGVRPPGQALFRPGHSGSRPARARSREHGRLLSPLRPGSVATLVQRRASMTRLKGVSVARRMWEKPASRRSLEPRLPGLRSQRGARFFGHGVSHADGRRRHVEETTDRVEVVLDRALCVRPDEQERLAWSSELRMCLTHPADPTCRAGRRRSQQGRSRCPGTCGRRHLKGDVPGDTRLQARLRADSTDGSW